MKKLKKNEKMIPLFALLWYKHYSELEEATTPTFENCISIWNEYPNHFL